MHYAGLAMENAFIVCLECRQICHFKMALPVYTYKPAKPGAIYTDFVVKKYSDLRNCCYSVDHGKH